MAGNKTIAEYLDEQIDKRIQAWVNVFVYAGEESVKTARLNHKYLNQTGNLASSVGYAVIHNGQVIAQSSFDSIQDGAQGSANGRAYLQEIIAGKATGTWLILVAGMQYAAYVAAMNLDVLDSAEITANRIINDFKNKIGI